MPKDTPAVPEKGEKATKTLHQLSSSADAAKKHRDDSKRERAMRNLGDAVETMIKKETKSKDENGK